MITRMAGSTQKIYQYYVGICIVFGAVVWGQMPQGTCKSVGEGKLKCNGINSLSPEILTINASHITDLDISLCAFTNITANTFKSLVKLQRLNCTDGNLTHIESGAFSQTPELSHVSFDKNKISSIDTGVFAQLTNLVYLDLSGNKINILRNGTFTHLPVVRDLYLAWNNISVIEQNAFVNLTSLEWLELTGNQLTHVPNAPLRPLTALSTLNMNYNAIRSLEANAFHELTNLRQISLHSNNINAIDDNAFGSSGLDMLGLHLHGNRLTKVPTTALKRLRYLHTLYIGENLFEEIETGAFEGLIGLKQLSLEGSSQLRAVKQDAFKEQVNLVTLWMNNNKQLSYIEERAFSFLSKLRYIYLDGNALKTIQENLLNWNQLIEVDLRNNKLQCDCQIRWMVETQAIRRMNFTKTLAENLTCSTKNGVSHRVMSLTPKSLICDNSKFEQIHQTQNRLKTGLIVSAILAVSVIGFALLIKFRRKISLRARWYFRYHRHRDEAVFTLEDDVSDIDRSLEGGKIRFSQRYDEIQLVD